MAERKRIGDLLIEKDLITEEQLEEALKLQVGGNRRVGHLLIKLKFITEEALVKVLSEQLGVEPIGKFEVPKADKKLIPRYLCRKYNVCTIATKPNNVLELAMVNPLDEEAIDSIEAYTGRVVKPFLTKQSVIITSIKNEIPFTWNTVFNQQNFGWAAKATSALVVICVIVLVGMITKDLRTDKYGTTSNVNGDMIHKNLDLMIGFNKEEGTTSFLGRGAHTDGIFSVTFKNTEQLESFLEKKKSNFSGKQLEWIAYVLENNTTK